MKDKKSVHTNFWFNSRVLVIANREITMKPCLYGEDYYIQKIIEELRLNGISVDIIVMSNQRHLSNILKIARNYDVFILHNISPWKVFKAKIKHGIKIVMPVYFLWNKSSPLIYNLISRMGLTLWQLIIDEYIVPSPQIAKGLRLQGIFKRICFKPPAYKCEYCNPEENFKKLMKLREELPPYVKVTYIGSLSCARLPLSAIIKIFNSDKRRMYEVTIYTATSIKNKAYKIGNVNVNIVRKVLSEEEKCKVLRESHLFIEPKHMTTMQPSISVMEAEYHGNIIVRV